MTRAVFVLSAAFAFLLGLYLGVHRTPDRAAGTWKATPQYTWTPGERVAWDAYENEALGI